MKPYAFVPFVLVTALAAAAPNSDDGARVPVQTLELDNGLEVLLVRRPELTTVACGWIAHVGSANERPGITGLSHLFEHMLFKGTHAIGTTDIDRDLEIIEEQERLQERIREIYRDQRTRWRRGEIEDPFDPETRPAELVQLEGEFQVLVEEQRELMIKDEYDKIYSNVGATGINAGTTNDITIYFVTLPANKLELWFWMESDRLANPVMREFYSERDVVHEERRLRTESTPTGKFDEQFDAMFWESHPYSWPVVGWPSDLRVITKEQADDYFATYYAPNNLTAALVGNFDVDEVTELAQRYFGRLERDPRGAPDVVTMEMEQLAEKRMNAECDCQPQTSVRYHTVPFMHADSYSLDVLAGLLNGRTGRLYKGLVLEREIAASASAGQDSSKYAGAFSFQAETKGDARPEDLEEAWYEELAKLQNEPIPARELQKVKNQIAADAYRNLESPFFLMLQLLFYDAQGSWEYINNWADATLAVTEADVKRVIEAYFAEENRAVALYHRKAGTEAAELPPELAALPADQRKMVEQQLQQLEQIEDPAQLEQILSSVAGQKASAPEEFHAMIDFMETWIQNRIGELSAAADQEGGQ